MFYWDAAQLKVSFSPRHFAGAHNPGKRLRCVNNLKLSKTIAVPKSSSCTEAPTPTNAFDGGFKRWTRVALLAA